VSGMDCTIAKIARNEDFYCWNGNAFMEKYKVGDHVASKVIRRKNLMRISRSSDLMGVELRVTALARGHRNDGLIHGHDRVSNT
jgi:hypothetical protein